MYPTNRIRTEWTRARRRGHTGTRLTQPSVRSDDDDDDLI